MPALPQLSLKGLLGLLSQLGKLRSHGAFLWEAPEGPPHLRVGQDPPLGLVLRALQSSHCLLSPRDPCHEPEHSERPNQD